MGLISSGSNSRNFISASSTGQKLPAARLETAWERGTGPKNHGKKLGKNGRMLEKNGKHLMGNLETKWERYVLITGDPVVNGEDSTWYLTWLMGYMRILMNKKMVYLFH